MLHCHSSFINLTFMILEKNVYKIKSNTEVLRWLRLFENSRKLQTLEKSQRTSSKSTTARNVAFGKKQWLSANTDQKCKDKHSNQQTVLSC